MMMMQRPSTRKNICAKKEKEETNNECTTISSAIAKKRKMSKPEFATSTLMLAVQRARQLQSNFFCVLEHYRIWQKIETETKTAQCQAKETKF